MRTEMVRRRRGLFRSLLIVFAVCCGPSSTSLAQELTFFRPVGALFAEGSEVALRAAYHELGFQIFVEPMSADVALERSINGESDGEINRVHALGDRVTTLIRVPTPLAYLSTVAVYRRDSGIDISEIADLVPYRVVRVGGIVHAEIATQGVDNVQVVVDRDALLALVASGEADVGVESLTGIRVALNRLGMEGALEVSDALSTTDMHHYLHARHADLVPRLDAILARMAQDGILERIQRLFAEEYLRETHNRR